MNVLDPPHLDILPAVCTNNRLYLIEDSREPDPRDRRCLASNSLDDLELNLALGDRSQHFLGMRNVHVSFQSLAYGLVHDDCSLEALRELAESYAAEIRPLRDRSESSGYMDKSSLEEPSSFRRGYGHLVHLNLGETANHLHNIIGVHSTYGLEYYSVGILLDSDADACLVGQQVPDEPGQGPVDQRSQVGVDDDEVVPLFDRQQVVIWDREALFVLLVCLRYGTFKRLRVRRIFFAQRLSYFPDLFPCL